MTQQRPQDQDGSSNSLRDRLDRLVATAAAIGGEREHRREILVERAEERGLDRPTAEQAYDIAREESLQPALALALVLEGVSVQLMASPRPDVEASEPNEPEWVDAPPAPKVAERERRLRQTFRRLRARMEESGGAEAAVAALGGEPDLEPYDY